ncbi:Transposase, MuDR, plant [Corchorus olitorius]|uniref:Transposase, MuDR, plant n=1 Tax=Corchorus olitorius TaxID=93759 RepID=A0A1R3HHP3_9ROSI|nr:Transposase, MuDR, plant [Corchorus olitorius]
MAGQYYIQIYHVGRFVRDPYLRYEGGEFVRALDVPDTLNWAILENIIRRTIGYQNLGYFYYYNPHSKDFDDGIRYVFDDTSCLSMINVWEKYHEITLYVDHLVEEDPQVVELLENSEGVNVPRVNGEVVAEGVGVPHIEVVDLQHDVKEMVHQLRLVRKMMRKMKKMFMMIENAAGEGDAVARRVESDDDNHSDDAGSIEEEGRWHPSGFLRYNPIVEYPDFQSGMVFNDVYQFRDAVRKYALVYRRELEFVKNDKNRVRVKCNKSENCPWFIFAIDCKISKGFCSKEHRDNPKLKLLQIQGFIDDKLKVNVGLRKWSRVKKLVRDEIAGNYIDQYKLIWDYANEFRVKNPSSTIKKQLSYKFFLLLSIETVFNMSIPTGMEGSLEDHLNPYELLQRHKHPRQRTRAFQRENSKCDFVDNNESENGCEVKKGRMKYTMHLRNMTCDCRACAYDLQPINGDHEWAKTGREPLLPPLCTREKVGRPKVNQRKKKDEPKKIGKFNRRRTIITCGQCGAEGHNRTACRKLQAAEAPQNARKKSLSNAATKVGQSRSKPQSARPFKPPGRAPPTEPKGKGKAHAADPIDRPCRQRKPSFKGMGLCNQKNGDPKPYYGYSRSKEIAANMYVSTKGVSTYAAGSLPSKTSHKGATKGKRKAPANPVGTQESVKKNK